MAAGVAALIFASHTGFSNADVVKTLCDTADKIAGTGTNWTCGRINAGNAVASVSGTISIVPSLPIVGPTWNCLGGNPCSSPDPSPIPNQSPALSIPVTSIQPTYTQPGNPSPSINGPINNPPNNPNSELIGKIACFFILLIIQFLGIDLSSLGIDINSICNNS